MKKVLLITDVDFWAKGAGHRMRISSLVEYLLKHVQVTIAYVGVVPENIEKGLRINSDFNFILLEKTRVLTPREYGPRLKKFLRNTHFDSIIIEYIHNSYFLNYLHNDKAMVILDAHDIISDRTNEFKQFNYEGSSYEMREGLELQILNLYDKVMLICQPDFQKIKTIIGSEKALLCPHPAIPCRQIINKEVKNIAFIASEYLPNKDAIQFFINNCWNHIFEIYPVQLCIYGNICNVIDVPKNKNIILKGYKPNLEEVYQEIDIIINPVRFGAGLKIKNIEALANGLPLITTSHGARGLEAAQNKAFLVADDSIDFTKLLISLIENEDQRIKLSNNAFKFIRDNFSAEKCFSPLMEVIFS